MWISSEKKYVEKSLRTKKKTDAVDSASGAIAGPIVSFDLRTFYLRDLTFTGSTVISPEVMPRLISYIEAKAIKPVLAATYALKDLRAAQTAFINKAHAGNIVVCP